MLLNRTKHSLCIRICAGVYLFKDQLIFKLDIVVLIHWKLCLENTKITRIHNLLTNKNNNIDKVCQSKYEKLKQYK